MSWLIVLFDHVVADSDDTSETEPVLAEPEPEEGAHIAIPTHNGVDEGVKQCTLL